MDTLPVYNAMKCFGVSTQMLLLKMQPVSTQMAAQMLKMVDCEKPQLMGEGQVQGLSVCFDAIYPISGCPTDNCNC
jgi:hypothetical protein